MPGIVRKKPASAESEWAGEWGESPWLRRSTEVKIRMRPGDSKTVG